MHVVVGKRKSGKKRRGEKEREIDPPTCGV
jgi:hypothetical protein